MDNFDLHTEIGSTFSAQIVNALRSASLLVLVDLPAARASDYVDPRGASGQRPAETHPALFDR